MSAKFQSTLPVWGATLVSVATEPLLGFQSTLPVWGATWRRQIFRVPEVFQSTLPVWGATFNMIKTPFDMRISIHAPRVGSDRPPPRQPGAGVISIHAPRVGSDGPEHTGLPGTPDFNPRSPCGERPAVSAFKTSADKFQSTLPVWGATQARPPGRPRGGISIHAPRVGSDSALL